MDYTRKLVSILYTGIKHNIKDLESFRNYLTMNLSDTLDFIFEDNDLVFLSEGMSFFVVTMREKSIEFFPGENPEALNENPILIRDALLGFLIQFKNYNIIENAEDDLLSGPKALTGSVKPVRDLDDEEYDSIKKGAEKYYDSEELDSEDIFDEHSDDLTQEGEDEEEEESSSDEYI